MAATKAAIARTSMSSEENRRGAGLWLQGDTFPPLDLANKMQHDQNTGVSP
eukprot:c38143_g1_i1 orf=3-152(-)